MAHKPRAPHVNLEITQEIIEDSIQRQSSHCVIAEAVKAAVPGALKVSVDLQTIRFTDPKRPYRYSYLTPRRGQVALVNFDQGRSFEPFSLRLRGGSVHARNPRANPMKKVLVTRDRTTGSVPEVVGGALPPRGPLASDRMHGGQRRQFGLRAFEL